MFGQKWNNLAISSVMLKMLHSFYIAVARSSENNVGHIFCYILRHQHELTFVFRLLLITLHFVAFISCT